VKPQIAAATDALTLYDATQENTGQTAKVVAQELKKYKAALGALPPAVRGFTVDLIALKKEYASWSASLAQDTFKPLRTGLSVIRTILPLLSPVIRNVSAALNDFMLSVLQASRTTEFKQWILDFSAAAGTTLRSALEITTNLVVGFIAIIRAFIPTAGVVEGSLVSMSAAFRRWAETLQGSPGMNKFLAFGAQAGPMLANLGRALLQIVVSMQPFLGITVSLSSAFASLVAHTPAPMLAGIVQAFIVATAVVRIWTPVMLAAKAAMAIGGVAKASVIGLQNFSAGLGSAKAAASAFTGTAGTLGGIVRSTGSAMSSAAVSAILWVSSLRNLTLAQIAATASMVLHRSAVTLARVALTAWTAAQWLLNAALRANPIGLVITAITALSAGLVIAWKNSQTFRSTIIAAWSAIKSSIGSVIKWMTSSVLPTVKSVWNSIWSTLKVVGSWVVTTLGPWFKTFGSILEMVFKAVVIVIKAAWVLGIKPIFAAMGIVLKAMGASFREFYNIAVKPAWTAVKTIIQTSWTAIKSIWVSSMQPGLRALGAVFRQLYTTFVKPAWDSIKSVISSSWAGIRPVFSSMKTGVSAVKTAFEKSRDGIRTAWNSLEGIAKKPIKFIIQTVLNNGLIKAFNWLGGKVGGPHIDNIPMPFAAGGVLPGYTPGRDVHQFYSPTGGRLALSGGEAVMRPEFTRLIGGAKGVNEVNALARQGMLPWNYSQGGVLGQRSLAGGGVPHAMSSGGVIDWIKKQGSSALSWIGNTASSIYKAVTHPLTYLTSKIPAISSDGLGAYAKPAVHTLASSAADKVTSLWKSVKAASVDTGIGMGSGSLGGTGWQKQWAAVHKRFPTAQLTSSYRPGAITATGNRSYHSMGRAIDVSPRMDIFNWIRSTYGKSIKELIFSPAGGRQIKNGRNLLYGEPVRSMHFNHVHWAMKHGGIVPQVFDRGGILPPGVSAVQNNTGSPETLVRPDMMAGTTNIEIKLSMDDLRQLKTLEDFLTMMDRARVNQRRTARSGTVTA
jgi:hypothetical protein